MERSKNGNFSFQAFTPGELRTKTSIREGERKIGEEVSCEVADGSAFVILGICEDFGPQANKGNGGAMTAFDSFLSKFLSVQSNAFLNGKNLVLPGFINPNKRYEEFDEAGKQTIIAELDDFVVSVLAPYIEKNITPVIIGGGHNNAYPILKAFSQKLQHPMAVVNCDAHADFRACDYRHSGNPFSFAHKDGLLRKYAMLGLHQSYNNQYILDEIKKYNFLWTWYDDLLSGSQKFDSGFEDVMDYFMSDPFGIELDMDSIAYMPSSALSPSGITLLDARRYVTYFASRKTAKYLHLPEAAPATDTEKSLVGKALAYLVCDFLKAWQKSFH